jgi:magnesium-transporting ATPase (P-type)
MTELPAEVFVILQFLVVGIVTFLVTQGLKALAKLFSKDFSRWASMIVAIFVATIMFFLQQIVGLLPPNVAQIVFTIVGLIGMVLSAMGIHYSYKGLSPK